MQAAMLGDERTVKRFLFFPKRINGKIKWLQFHYGIQRYVCLLSTQNYTICGWKIVNEEFEKDEDPQWASRVKGEWKQRHCR